jgi:AcrR family transcriptional regulator
MKKKAGRPKMGKSNLTKQAIVQAAFDIVHEKGIDSLSMRQLASKLGVDAMAVYYHLKNKNAVLDELVNKAIDFSDFQPFGETKRSTENWKIAVKNFARFYLELFRAHKDLMLYLIINPSSGKESIQTGNEILFSILQDSKLSSSNIIRITDVIVDYLNGYGLAESTGRIPNNDERILQYQKWLETPESDNYPVTKNIVQSAEGNIATDFNLGLDYILDGIDEVEITN